MAFLSESPSTVRNAWISPAGEFFPVAFGGHSAFAKEKCAELGIEPSVDSLEAAGWLHISAMAFFKKRRPTSAQFETLFDWAVVCEDTMADAARSIQDFIELES